MDVLAPAVAGVVTFEVLSGWNAPRPLLAAPLLAAPLLAAPLVPALLTAAAVARPVLALPMLLTIGMALWGRRVTRRRDVQRAADDDVALLADLTALGVGAGLPFPAALQRAAAEVHPELRREVTGMLRSARLEGSASALLAAPGRARRLYRVAARAGTTGAPLLDAIESHAAELRAEAHAAAQAEARRLPVKMLFPLALLILPGFLLITVAPSVLGALQRLDL